MAVVLAFLAACSFAHDCQSVLCASAMRMRKFMPK
jgi:hypothetical protein